MLDTVLLLSPKVPPRDIASRITSPQEIVDGETGAYISTQGHIKNLRINAFGDRLLIKGSIARAARGSNFYVADPRQTSELLGEVGDTLGVDLMEANAYRVDFGLNAILPIPTSEALATLGPAVPYRKDTYASSQTGVYYRSGKVRSLAFYDKVAEAKAKRAPVPPEFQGKHVVRYEVQLKRKVESQIGEPVYGRTLCEPRFHHRLLERLEQELERVTIVRTSSVKVLPTWKEYRDSRCYLGIERLGGVEAELERLRTAKVEGVFGDVAHAYYRIRKGILELARDTSATGTNRAGDVMMESILGSIISYKNLINN